MEQSGKFRTSVFGGYNKDDVDDYIRSLAGEMEAAEEQHQNEKKELLQKVQESETELARVRYELEMARTEAAAQAGPSGDPKRAEEGDKDALKMLEEELGRVIGAPPQEDYSELEAENERLREELKKQKETLEKRQEPDDLFDYETVRKIMEEARNNAWLIEKEARQEADAILESARQRVKAEEDEQRHLIASRINAQLEEKGVQLMAAKYKIEQYIKEISSAQQGLYMLNARMEKMVKDMPVRLDDYWEGKDFHKIEMEEIKEDKDEKEAENRIAGR